MSDDPRQITITSTRPSLSVTAWLGAEPTTVTGGYGGWDLVARPRRQALTIWKGHEPYSMDVSILLDGFDTNSSVEARCTALERMARPPKELDEPPLVRITGSVPHSDLTWVVNKITWGDVIRSESGQRVRQALVIALVRYIADDRVQLGSSAAKARRNATTALTGKKSKGISKTYTVKSGDTIQKIAANELGDYRRAGEIAKLNGIRDGKTIKVNQVLKMP